MSRKKKRRPQPGRASRQPTKDYRTEKYVEYIFTAELGVFQAATLLPELADGEVLAALEKLAVQVRSGGLPRFREQPTDTEGLIAWLIVQGWEDLFRRRGRLSPHDMVGCLETVIESAETHMRKPAERSYLEYLAKFMRRAGVSLQVIPVSEFEDAEEEELSYDLGRMSLAELGALWLRNPGSVEIEDSFEDQAHTQIASGQAKQVTRLCQELLEQTQEPDIQATLYTLLGTAYRRLGQPDQAVTMLQSARSSDPTNTYALDELAETYCELGQYEQAIRAWQGCLEDAPGSAAYYYPQIARAYRQIGNLAGEEQAWRDLLKARERRGFWTRLWRQSQSVAALAQLADCLQRQGKAAEWLKVKRRMEYSWPHPDDPFEDWAYWVRCRLEREQMIESLSGALRDAQKLMPEPAWSQVLQACVYDYMGQPQTSAPIWQSIRRQLSGTARRWVLTQARDIMGELIPRSSLLFDLSKEEV
jgi:tetratricopeptide (TPR) repeat protein